MCRNNENDLLKHTFIYEGDHPAIITADEHGEMKWPNGMYTCTVCDKTLTAVEMRARVLLPDYDINPRYDDMLHDCYTRSKIFPFDLKGDYKSMFSQMFVPEEEQEELYKKIIADIHNEDLGNDQ